MHFFSQSLIALASSAVLFTGLLAAPVVAQQPAKVTANAERILSIGGDVTEILYALGAQSRIVAVDTSSQFPPEALKEKKSVGYMRALSPEGVLSVAPDLVVASDRAGPADIVRTLKSAVTYVEVPEGDTARGITLKIDAVARAIGDEARGKLLAARVSADLQTLAVERQRIAKPLRALFVLSVQSGRATIGGSDTSADAILKLAGLENAAAGISGFKPVNDEALVGMRPDIVVTMKRSTGGGHEAGQILTLAGLALSPAREQNRVIEMDGLYLLGFGPRVAAAARDLMGAAYPELASVTPSR